MHAHGPPVASWASSSRAPAHPRICGGGAKEDAWRLGGDGEEELVEEPTPAGHEARAARDPQHSKQHKIEEHARLAIRNGAQPPIRATGKRTPAAWQKPSSRRRRGRASAGRACSRRPPARCWVRCLSALPCRPHWLTTPRPASAPCRASCQPCAGPPVHLPSHRAASPREPPRARGARRAAAGGAGAHGGARGWVAGGGSRRGPCAP
eukprot:scaffold197352_cov28-Tisochrysis_lutea.AAC.2